MNVNKCFFLSVANIWRIFWNTKFLGTEKSTITPFRLGIVFISKVNMRGFPCLLGVALCGMLLVPCYFVICLYIVLFLKV